MRRKQILFLLLLTLLPWVSLRADVWQDPETKVNYEYTVGENEASVKAGYYGGSSSSAGSPEAAGDVAIRSKITVNGNEYIVTDIGEYAFNYCRTLTGVTIPEGIASIGGYAFNECI